MVIPLNSLVWLIQTQKSLSLDASSGLLATRRRLGRQ